MTTYLATKPFKLTRKEGDSGDIVLKVPDVLSMTGRKFQFQIRDSFDNIRLTKTEELGATITGQIISIVLNESDLVGLSGTHTWEAEVTNPGRITIGFGTFVVLKDRNK